MSRRALVLSITAALAGFALPLPALATPAPPLGYTGKPNPGAPQGETCNGCHMGGNAPQVTITGPTTLAAGATADYTLRIQSGGTGNRGAGAVAVPGSGPTPTGGTLIGSADMEVPFPTDPSEATTKAPPKSFTGGVATYSFSYKAPAFGGVVTMWAVGLAANGNGTGGDRATAIVHPITINGPPPPTDGGVGADAGQDGGASASSSSGGSSGGGSSSSGGSSGGGSSGGGGGSSGASSTGASPNDADAEAGCAVGRGPRAGAHALAFAAMVALALRVRRRRRATRRQGSNRARRLSHG